MVVLLNGLKIQLSFLEVQTARAGWQPRYPLAHGTGATGSTPHLATLSDNVIHH